MYNIQSNPRAVPHEREWIKWAITSHHRIILSRTHGGCESHETNMEWLFCGENNKWPVKTLTSFSFSQPLKSIIKATFGSLLFSRVRVRRSRFIQKIYLKILFNHRCNNTQQQQRETQKRIIKIVIWCVLMSSPIHWSPSRTSLTLWDSSHISHFNSALLLWLHLDAKITILNDYLRHGLTDWIDLLGLTLFTHRTHTAVRFKSSDLAT